jgi:tetratricopeptide (TPR) repeat protein
MPPQPFPLARTGARAVLALSLAVLGCSAPAQVAGAPKVASEAPLPIVDVRDEDFATGLHRILRDGSRAPERAGLLVGVVRRQLAHAAARFSAGDDHRAMNSVIGAFYLLRAGEGRSEMIDASGHLALKEAIEHVSRRGDEGRSLSLMRMRLATLPAGSPEKIELEQHLSALEIWMKDTRTGELMVRLGAEKTAAVHRALLDPSEKAQNDAAQAVVDWIARAIALNLAFQRTGARPSRGEVIEASSALESGGTTLAALFLRHGDARGAIAQIDRSGARPVVDESLYTRLRGAAVNDTARDWQALAAMLLHQQSQPRDPDTSIDAELLTAAIWGAALEAHRRDPSHFQTALLVAHMLLKLGMTEAAPLVLSDALGPSPNPAEVDTAMDLLLVALSTESDHQDLDTARRTFRAAEPLLGLADRVSQKARSDSIAPEIRFLMATLEARSGRLDSARPLLAAALRDKPSAAGYTMLALIERQAGNSAGALLQIDRALTAPDARLALLDLTEAQMLAFEIHRDAGDNRAKPALDAALQAVLAARQQYTDAPVRARAERQLARVLDAYGDAKGAARALDRALKLAADSRSLLGETMLDAVGRALVRRDLSAARSALKQGIDGDASPDDLIYGGLWVMLLERELAAGTDGTAERALRASGTRASWAAKLVAWATGKLSDADLGTSAQSLSQRVEADFYTAMAKKVAGDPAAAERLRAVSNSPVLDLLEVHLAREMLAPPLRSDVPRGLAIP